MATLESTEKLLEVSEGAERTVSAAEFGTDAAARARRRGLRERLNASAHRKLIMGILATLAGGTFWGFSGTCASYLFEHYADETAWLMV